MIVTWHFIFSVSSYHPNAMPRSPRTSNTSVISANRKNRNFAIDAVPALVLLKPNTPEMNEMIAKMMAHLSICLLLVLIENSVWFIARLGASNKTEKFWICVVIKNDGVMQHYVSLVSITITTLPGLWFVPGTQKQHIARNTPVLMYFVLANSISLTASRETFWPVSWLHHEQCRSAPWFFLPIASTDPWFCLRSFLTLFYSG